jgi:hypothetical protein
MKALYCLFLFLLIHVTSLWSQFADSFETWTQNNTSPPYNWEYPDGWSTSNPITEFCSFSVFKSDTAYTGAYAALLKSAFIFGEYKPGVLLLGNATYIFSTLQMRAKDGFDLDLIPHRVKGWYRFESEDPDAKGLVEIKVLRKNPATQADSVVLSAFYELNPVDTYTSFDFLISYFIPIDTEHDKLSLAFYSNRPQDITHPASLWIDDVSLDFISSTEVIHQQTGPSISVAPNPVTAGKDVKVTFNQPLNTSSEIYISDQSGRLIKRVPVTAFQTESIISTEALSAGVYYAGLKGTGQSATLIIY